MKPSAEERAFKWWDTGERVENYAGYLGEVTFFCWICVASNSIFFWGPSRSLLICSLQYFNSKGNVKVYNWRIVSYCPRLKRGAAVCSVATRTVRGTLVSCWSPWRRRTSGTARASYATWICCHTRRLRKLRSWLNPGWDEKRVKVEMTDIRYKRSKCMYVFLSWPEPLCVIPKRASWPQPTTEYPKGDSLTEQKASSCQSEVLRVMFVAFVWSVPGWMERMTPSSTESIRE